MEASNVPDENISLNGSTKHDVKPLREDKSFWSNITLEPMWLGLFISASVDVIIFKNLYIQRACLVDLGYSEEICYVSGTLNSSIEREAQKIITSISVWSGLISGLITCLTVIFLGPWSDASGRRKPLIMMSIASNIVSYLSTMAVLAMPGLSVIWVIFLRAIPHAFGSHALLSLSAYSYLGDVCYVTLRSATVVMGRNGISMFISFVLGSLLAPMAYRGLGFKGVTVIALVLQLFSLLYVHYKVQDFCVAKTIPSVFDVSLPLKAFKCLFKKREGYKRQIVLIMMLIPTAGTIIGANEMSIRYLYLRNTFLWTELEYGTILAVRMSINAIGLTMIVKLFKEKLKIRDEVIGVIGGISELADAIVFMFVTKSWMLFATSLFGILSSGPITVERPIINKHIRQDEQGKIYSIITILDMFVLLSVVPLSNFIYSRTLSWFPSCFMTLSAGGAVIQAICYIVMIQLSKKEEVREMKLSKLPNNGSRKSSILIEPTIQA